MKQALIIAKEIRRKRFAMQNTNSIYLLNDYSKSISKDIRDLRQYCRLKNISFSKIAKYIME